MTEIKSPGPDHSLTFSQPGRRVRALYQGHLIADTATPVITHEAGLPDAVYFPKADVEMSVLREAGTRTCAWKGQGKSYTIVRDGVFSEAAAWSFDQANPAAAVLSGMIGFDPKVVTLEVYGDESDNLWRKQAAEMSDYIRHTDSGSGTSQAEKWPANVSAGDDAEKL